MSIFKKRKKAPAIEETIRKKLKGEARKNALDFVAFSQANGFSFVGFDAGSEGYRWTPTYNGKGLGCVAVTNEFMFWVGLDWRFDDNGPVDDELKNFVYMHVVSCPQEPCMPPYCQGECHCKNRWQIFEKEFQSTCHSPLAFFGPDAISFENMKKLLLLTKST